MLWRPIRRRFGISAFGVNAWTGAAAGDPIIEDHTEQAYGHEELYVVLSGRARFTLGDDEVDAPAGTLIAIRDVDVRRSAIAAEPETTVLAVGAKPGDAYRPSAWESWYVAAPYLHTEPARAAELMRAELDANFESGSLLYNVACAEALAGEREAAIEHLRQALERDERTREWAKTDADLDAIRDDTRFPA
jgi:quercetin dioxygenase-like cupin family protein